MESFCRRPAPWIPRSVSADLVADAECPGEFVDWRGRRHLGVETQRQWSDPAINRTMPVLLGLFSVITLSAHQHYASYKPMVQTAAWYRKPWPTSFDALAKFRR